MVRKLGSLFRLLLDSYQVPYPLFHHMGQELHPFCVWAPQSRNVGVWKGHGCLPVAVRSSRPEDIGSVTGGEKLWAGAWPPSLVQGDSQTEHEEDRLG